MHDAGNTYELLRELKPGVSTLVTDAFHRMLVLKRVPSACLTHTGEINASVRQRLARLREIPLTSVAQLVCTDVWQGNAVLVYQYVPGVAWALLSASEQSRLAVQLRRLVESMHGLGLIHGAIHAQNIIIDDANNAVLIDPSPLLHDDPNTDLHALDALCGENRTERVESAVSDFKEPTRQRTLVAAVAIAVAALAACVAGVFYLS